MRRFLPFLICGVLFVAGFTVIPHEVDTMNFILHVEGKGYPPIQSENMAQARLMARRAAVLDAYRNILTLLGNEKEYPVDEAELAVTYGYIRGAQVIDEILLSDGRVSVKVAYPLSQEEMERLEKKSVVKGTIGTPQVRSRKPTILSKIAAVDLETWIEKLKEERQKAQKEVLGETIKPKPPITTQTIHEVREPILLP